VNLLREVQKIFKNEPQKLNELALQIKNGIERMDFVGLVKDSVLFTPEMMIKVVEDWKSNLDMEWGGHNGVPKFPMPVEYNFFLSYLSKNQDEEIRDYVYLSLTRMAWGGIYDHLGGGFSRYSVDRFWKVPHFEKMLYDQGQLVEVYSQAYQRTKKPLYKKVIEETIAFVNRELKSKEGGYFASLDADSEGEEGKFYAWTKEEVDEVLGSDAEIFCCFYNITSQGNWEAGKNVLFQTKPLAFFAEEKGMSEIELDRKIKECKQLLFHKRTQRIPPPLDHKVLTSWNAIMIKGLVAAYKALGTESYLADAIRTSRYMKQTALREDGGVWRSINGKKGSINAFLDDYALLIDAWIELYQVTFNEEWIMLAYELCEYVCAHFFNEDNQLFYYTSILDDPLIFRKTEIADNVIPSSNSIMAINIYRLSKYFLKKEGYHTAFQMLKNLSARIDEHVKYYANWQRLKLFYIHQNFELVLSGDNNRKAHKQFISLHSPFVFLAAGEHSLPISENKASKELIFHLCQNNSCHYPIKDISEVMERIYESELVYINTRSKL
jgi:uncharacterized protein YyaL (SSP411 family)